LYTQWKGFLSCFFQNQVDTVLLLELLLKAKRIDYLRYQGIFFIRFVSGR